MAVTLFVLFMKRRFDVLQTRPWQVERMALTLVTDIDAEVYFYIVIAIPTWM
jgi:predicted phosphatase